MRIDVTDILAQSEGYRTSFEIVDEPIELEDMSVAEKTSGELTLTRSEVGLELDGNFSLVLTLECNRCLHPYALPEHLRIRGEFSRLQAGPQDEERWPITKDMSIDLVPLIRQEAILALPIKQLCNPDCAGLDPDSGQVITTNH